MATREGFGVRSRRGSRLATLLVSLVAPSVIAAPALATPNASAAAATGAAASASTLARSAPTPAAPASKLPMLGLMLDAGVPDGANLSLAVRPRAWVRGQVGGGYNLISKGVRAGVSLIPFGQGPSLSFEAGRYFEGDANGLVQKVASGFSGSPILERVGYDYANAHVGLELGKRWVTFFIHGGMSYVRAQVRNLNAEIAGQSEKQADGSTTTVTVNKDPVVRAYTPSLKLGLLVYFW